MSTLTPGRYAGPSGHVFEVDRGGRWHYVYTKTTNRASGAVLDMRYWAKDVAAIEADPAAAAARAGRCPCCQAACGPDHRAEDCRSAKALGRAS